MKICAVDEVGVSSIAGPVFTAAILVDSSAKPIPGVMDSKALDREQREKLFPEISKAIVDVAYGAAGPREIERLNVHHAKLKAMRRAVLRLLSRGHHPSRTIVDGTFVIPHMPLYIGQEAIAKADRDFWEVSAASIMAKVTRDRMMKRLSKRDGLDCYGWETNAGYYSPKHRLGIIVHGPTAFHRKTFDLFKYCMFSHEEYVRILEDGGTADDFFEAENERRAAHGKKTYNHYRAWKRGELIQFVRPRQTV